MELTSGPLPRDEYLRAIDGIVEFMLALDMREILVCYGFGCDWPEEQLYQCVSMLVTELSSFIADAESKDYFRVGRDNLHVTETTGRLEFVLCHEADIHFIADDFELISQLKKKWLSMGYCKVLPHLGTEWNGA